MILYHEKGVNKTKQKTKYLLISNSYLWLDYKLIRRSWIQPLQQRTRRQCFHSLKPLGEDVKAGKNGKQIPSLLRYGKRNRLLHILLLAFREALPHCSPMLHNKEDILSVFFKKYA